MGISKGTKLTDTPKDKTLKFRYDSRLEAKLNALCETTSRTKAQVIRDGIEQQYTDLISK